MAYKKYDPNKFRKKIDGMFGSGTYSNGMETAKKIGTMKTQAEFAKKDYLIDLEEAKQLESEIQEYGMPKDQYDEEQKYKEENDKVLADELKKAKTIREKAQDQGRGGFLPTRENQMAQDNALKSAKKKGINFEEMTPYSKAQMKKEKEAKKKKKEEKSFFGKVKKTFDFVGDSNKNGRQDGLDFLDKTLGRASEGAHKMVAKGLQLDGFNDAKNDNYKKNYKKTNNKQGQLMQKATTKKATTKLEKASDIAGAGIGIAALMYPGAGASKVASGALKFSKATRAGSGLASKVAAKAGDTAVKKVAKQAVKLGGKGALTGTVYGSGQAGLTELVDPNLRTKSEHAKLIGIEAGAGAVLDPLIGIGGAKLLSKISLTKPVKIAKGNSDITTPNALKEGDKVTITQDGASAEMTFVRIQDEHIIVKRNNGKEISVPKQLISTKDIPTPTKSENQLMTQEDVKDLTLKNSDNWKDKSPFFLKRETMDRNFDDVMGKDAPFMKDKFLSPVHKSEAERTRFLNAQRAEVKAYGIKPKSRDDELVQKFGEGHITEDELKAQTDNWQQVKEVAGMYRAKYDSLLNTINEALVDAGQKPIPKRENYFPHFEEIDGILAKFGMDMTNHTLPTDINGMTQNFKPTKNFFANAMRRKGDKTDYGAMQGFDRYIEGASNLIHHTKNIGNLRGLEKDIRNKYEGETDLSNFVAEISEFTNVLAGKKTLSDRAVEGTVGRKAFNVVDTIRRRVGANMVGANVASALTGFIPIPQALATVGKRSMVKGMLETMQSTLKKDDFIQRSDFLTKRAGADVNVKRNVDKIIDASFYLMREVDMFSAQSIVRGKYNEGIAKGLHESVAMKQADEWASKIMGGRAKGEMPTLFNSKTIGLVSQFQLEVNNQVSFLAKDIPRNFDKVGATKAFTKVLLFDFLFNEMYEAVVGRRPAFDPVGIAFEAVEDYNNDNISNKRATWNTTKNVLGTLPFTSTFTGGRIPIGASLPNIPAVMQEKADWKEEAVKPLIYFAPPAGGSAAYKAYEANKIFKGEEGVSGVYTKSGDMNYPVDDNLGNKARGYLFGKSTLPETDEYYDNARRKLSANQTERIQNALDPQEEYETLMKERRIKTLKNKLKKAKSEASQYDLMIQIDELQGGE